MWMGDILKNAPCVDMDLFLQVKRSITTNPISCLSLKNCYIFCLGGYQ